MTTILFTSIKYSSVLKCKCLQFATGTHFKRYSGSKSYRHTVLLPHTVFPHRVTNKMRELWDKNIEKNANFNSLYSWQESNNTGNLFILHDGPPYANGDVHLGHFINKVLKDISVRFRVLQGQKVSLVPGWDCHGLPIELKVLKAGEENDMTPTQIRSKARQFAKEAMGSQKSSFQEWGLLANWEKPYTTNSPNYIIQELKAFDLCYKKGLIYQDYKPVYWSPVTRTSLAEAELEYNEKHISHSMYVEFLLTQLPDLVKSETGEKPVYLLIWTTTPWTLPSNQAVAYSSSHGYCLVKHDQSKHYWIVALSTVDSLKKALDSELLIMKQFEGSALRHCEYQHPIYPEEHCCLLDGTHVTMEKGTGLVHTAPNHGFEDYDLICAANIPLQECLVDEHGKMTSKAGASLSGLSITSKECGLKISALLGPRLVQTERYIHSYPYDWRSKTPVIIRTSRQWLLDVEKIRGAALDCLDEIKIHPEAAKTALKTFIKNRPHWCISRQRSWGVPIPVFYSKSENKPYTSSYIIEHLCKLIKENNADIWWSSSTEDLLPQSVLEQSGFPLTEEYLRGTEIFDIWFDSGLSWNAVLPEGSVADLCVEGKDQSRGWFQSLLLTSIALRNKAPYKSLLVHGFVTDEKRQKMSKSVGNILEPKTLITGSKDKPGVGVDAVRWWVAQHDSFASDYCLSKKSIEKSASDIAKIRNFLKFILGNLSDFNYENQCCIHPELLLNDKYMLHCLQEFSNKVMQEYIQMKYSTFVRQHLDEFLSRLTSFYFEAIKDRLYCDEKTSLSRRSCQTTLCHILEILVRSLAPVVPHLAEEAFLHHPDPYKRSHGVFRTMWKDTSNLGQLLSDSELLTFNIVEQIHSAVSKSSEILNTSFSNVDLSIKCNTDVLNQLQILQMEEDSSYSELCTILRVASVTLLSEVHEHLPSIHRASVNVSLQNIDYQVELLFSKARFEVCDRCRRCTSPGKGHLCTRCSTVLANIT